MEILLIDLRPFPHNWNNNENAEFHTLNTMLHVYRKLIFHNHLIVDPKAMLIAELFNQWFS